MKPNLEPQVDRYYQAPLRSRTRKHERMKVSIFDVNYPTPEQCRRILAANGKSISVGRGADSNRNLAANQKSISVDQESDSNQILSPDGVPISIRRSSDFNPSVLLNLLVEQVPNFEGAEDEVIAKIFEVAESHLRKLLLQLSEISGHRMEPLRMNQMYQQINDPRKQLKFIEEQENKALIRRQEAIAKETSSKAKNKENAQTVKEFKNANQEEKLNREANEAAIAALGGNRTVKNWGRFDTMKAPIGQGMNTQTLRTKTRRITIRDLQCAIECKNIPGHAIIKSQLAYGHLQSSNGG